MNYQTWKSPIGRLHFVANEEGLLALAFDVNWPQIRKKFDTLLRESHPHIEQVIAELEEYFQGTRKTFSVPIAQNGTPFQQKAWRALNKIPYGKTATYREQAVKIRNPKAVRAVGRANGMNRVGILIPCHRVIGANGSLTGYAGGIEAKRKLLDLESNHANS